MNPTMVWQNGQFILTYHDKGIQVVASDQDIPVRGGQASAIPSSLVAVASSPIVQPVSDPAFATGVTNLNLGGVIS